jgi:hypothetical protein
MSGNASAHSGVAAHSVNSCEMKSALEARVESGDAWSQLAESCAGCCIMRSELPATFFFEGQAMRRQRQADSAALQAFTWLASNSTALAQFVPPTQGAPPDAPPRLYLINNTFRI